jgi:hypothetical protein
MSHLPPQPPLAVELAATSGAAAISVAVTHAGFVATHAWAQDLFSFLGAAAAIFSLFASVLAITARILTRNDKK